MRIISLLPSATEILFELGVGDDVVGVTFECDFPLEARQRRIVSTSALPEHLTPAEIDADAVVVRPGPRVVDGVEAIASILHRDAAGAPDPQVVQRLR